MHVTPLPARAAVTMREATDVDDHRILEIAHAAFPDHRETLDEFRHARARRHARGLADELAVAETPDAGIVGYWHFNHMMGQYDPGRYRVLVFVDPARQRRGVGGALFDHMARTLAERDARAVESFARETSPEVIAFLIRRGFHETLRNWELRLDLGRFDPAPFARHIERVRDAGVEIVTLEQERLRDPDALRRAHEVREVIMADIPSPIPPTPVPFEEFMHNNVAGPRALPAAYFLAKVGSAYVGEASLRRPPEGTHLFHHVTGVLPAYRGRGIAMALKLATITYGQAYAFSEIRTQNEVRNAGMLAINERLGFVRQPAWITFEKALEAGATAARHGTGDV